MAVILGAVLALVPILIAPGALFYFDVTPKIAVLLFGAAAGLLWLAARGRLSPLLAFPLGRWFSALLAVALASLLLSAALSKHPLFSLGGTNWRRLGALSWAAILIFAALTGAWTTMRPEWPRAFCRIASASGLVAAVYGILQYFSLDPLLDPLTYHSGEGPWAIVRPPGTLGQADYFAVYLGVVVFAGVAAGIADRRPAWKRVGWAAAVLSSIAIVLSGTRAGILGVLCGAALFAVCERRRFRARSVAVAALAALLASVFFYVSPAGQKLRARVHWSLDDPAGGARPLLWRDSLRMASARWATGYGPDTFGSEFPRFQSAALAREYPDRYHESPHNVLLDVLTTGGAGCLAALLALYAIAFRAAATARKREPVLAAALASALLATLVSQQFTSFIGATALYSFALIGVLVGMAAQPAASETPPRAPRTLHIAAVAAPVAILTAAGVMFLAADAALAHTARDLEAGDLRTAAEHYARSRRWQIAGAGSDLWFSRRMAAAAQRASTPALRFAAWQSAFAAAIRAPRYAEDPQNAWYSLASFYAGENDYSRAVAALREAVASAPGWFKPHWVLAQAFRTAGQTAEARREARIAVELDGGKHPEVGRTLKDLEPVSRGPAPAP